MWSMLQSIFSTYNGTSYSLKDFVWALSPSNPNYSVALAIAGLTFAIGFIEYIYSFILVNREKKSPYNVLMHTFYFAIDSMGIFVFALASHATHGFWVFTAASVAEVIWTFFEIYNLVLCIYVERDDIWGSSVTSSQAWWKIIGWILVMIPMVNLFRVFMNDTAMLKWYIFTNILMGIMPGLYWEKRKTQIGASWGLAIVICIGTINSFLLTNMWATISSYFSIQNNPWFYVMGIVAIFFSFRTFWVLKKLPKKPRIMTNGKKSIW